MLNLCIDCNDSTLINIILILNNEVYDSKYDINAVNKKHRNTEIEVNHLKAEYEYEIEGLINFLI